jgi:hypothetical protein
VGLREAVSRRPSTVIGQSLQGRLFVLRVAGRCGDGRPRSDRPGDWRAGDVEVAFDVGGRKLTTRVTLDGAAVRFEALESYTRGAPETPAIDGRPRWSRTDTRRTPSENRRCIYVYIPAKSPMRSRRRAAVPGRVGCPANEAPPAPPPAACSSDADCHPSGSWVRVQRGLSRADRSLLRRSVPELSRGVSKRNVRARTRRGADRPVIWRLGSEPTRRGSGGRA